MVHFEQIDDTTTRIQNGFRENEKIMENRGKTKQNYIM